MSIKSKWVLAFALAALVTFVVASSSFAAHPRPKGATPVLVSMVPAFKQCTLPNSNHGTPLASPSCNPPVQESNFLTVGSPDAGGGAANSVGSIRIDVITGVPGPPDDSDVKLVGSSTDIRCKPAAATQCGSANAANGPDYTGSLLGNAMIRISDHYNGSPAFTSPATVVDLPFPVSTPCTGTPTDTTIGSRCAVSTTANTVVPGVTKDGKRAVVEIQQIYVEDGGNDGIGSTEADNTVFARQGIFIP
jgi:hypothetical protein